MPVYWRSVAGIITSASGGITTELAVCKLAMTWLGADPASLTDIGTITSSSSKEEVLCNVVYDSARKAVLEAKNWQFATEQLALNLAAGTDEADYDAVTITGITAADPVVITAASHGFQDGWFVKISDVSGMTEINGRIVRVSSKATDTFACYQLDGSKFTAYTSGGQAIRYEINPDYANGYCYEVPDDMRRPIATLPEGSQFEIVGSGNSRRLLCTASDAVLEYVADKSTVSEMPDHFIRTWAARIAAELAPALAKKGAVMKDMWAFYKQTLDEGNLSNARNVDAKSMIRESSPSLDDGGWE